MCWVKAGSAVMVGVAPGESVGSVVGPDRRRRRGDLGEGQDLGRRRRSRRRRAACPRRRSWPRPGRWCASRPGGGQQAGRAVAAHAGQQHGDAGLGPVVGHALEEDVDRRAVTEVSAARRRSGAGGRLVEDQVVVGRRQAGRGRAAGGRPARPARRVCPVRSPSHWARPGANAASTCWTITIDESRRVGHRGEDLGQRVGPAGRGADRHQGPRRRGVGPGRRRAAASDAERTGLGALPISLAIVSIFSSSVRGTREVARGAELGVSTASSAPWPIAS